MRRSRALRMGQCLLDPYLFPLSFSLQRSRAGEGRITCQLRGTSTGLSHRWQRVRAVSGSTVEPRTLWTPLPTQRRQLTKDELCSGVGCSAENCWCNNYLHNLYSNVHLEKKKSGSKFTDSNTANSKTYLLFVGPNQMAPYIFLSCRILDFGV